MDKLVIHSNAVETGGKQCADNPETHSGINAFYIYRTAKSVHGFSSPLFRQLIFHATVSGIDDKRNVCQRTGRLQTLHKFVIHLVNPAGRLAPTEFSSAEIRKLIRTAAHSASAIH